MGYCKHCGAQIPDDATFCPSCGKDVTGISSTENQSDNKFPAEDKYSVLTILGIVFTFLSSLIGLILSILAYNEAKRTFSLKNQSLAKTGIILSSVFIGLSVLLTIIITVCVIAGILAIPYACL